MTDERQAANRLLGHIEASNIQPLLLLFIGSLTFAVLGVWIPAYEGLSDAGHRGLFILFFAAALWVTDAIPAFAVGLVVMALAILMLGDVAPMQDFLAPWASPIIWLFFGGFVLAAATVKSGLDRWLSGQVLHWTGNSPRMVLLGAMASTFTFSMFMSNTATATMMLAVLLPVLARIDSRDSFRIALPLGIAFAANLGGMGTIIGSPPNAIAAGLLGEVDPVNFVTWSAVALPVAIPLAFLTWLFLCWRYPSTSAIDLKSIEHSARPRLPFWQRITIMVVFGITIMLWATSPLHGLSTTMVSFLPITIFTMIRVIGSDDVRGLPWDVLLLITGGLCLGEILEKTGVTVYIMSLLPWENLLPVALALSLAWVCSLMSNFMSNTAAANILLPLALALSGGKVEYVMPIALAASSAMCLPVSTPPNALAASRAGLSARDFMPWGLVVGLITTPAAVGICFLAFA